MFETFGVDQIDRLTSPNGRVAAVTSKQGAAIKQLEFDGERVIDVPMPTTNFSFAGSTMAPWPNRLDGARWQLDGREFQGEINEPKNGNNLHGLLVRRDFEIDHQTPDSITYKYTLGSDAVYPFEVDVTVQYRLLDDELICTLGATNRSEEIVPIGLGSHPYFNFDADSTITSTARKMAVNNERQLPVGEKPSILGIAEPARLDSLDLDDCFWDFGATERIFTLLSRPALGKTVEVWQEPALAYQMMFTRWRRKPTDTYEPLIAIEPQTAPANAFSTGAGLIWLAPGQGFEVSWGVALI